MTVISHHGISTCKCEWCYTFIVILLWKKRPIFEPCPRMRTCLLEYPASQGCAGWAVQKGSEGWGKGWQLARSSPCGLRWWLLCFESVQQVILKKLLLSCSQRPGKTPQEFYCWRSHGHWPFQPEHRILWQLLSILFSLPLNKYCHNCEAKNQPLLACWEKDVSCPFLSQLFKKCCLLKAVSGADFIGGVGVSEGSYITEQRVPAHSHKGVNFEIRTLKTLSFAYSSPWYSVSTDPLPATTLFFPISLLFSLEPPLPFLGGDMELQNASFIVLNNLILLISNFSEAHFSVSKWFNVMFC